MGLMDSDYKDLALLVFKYYLNHKKVKSGDWVVTSNMRGHMCIYRYGKLLATVDGPTIIFEHDEVAESSNHSMVAQAIWHGTPLAVCDGITYYVCYDATAQEFAVTTDKYAGVTKDGRQAYTCDIMSAQKIADGFTHLCDTDRNVDVVAAGSSYSIIRR